MDFFDPICANVTDQRKYIIITKLFRLIKTYLKL